MWPALIRRPSLLRELLGTLKQLLAAQQEANLLMRELLLRHGVNPRTPTLASNFPVTDNTLAQFLSQRPASSRVRTRNDVASTLDLPTTRDDQPDPELEPPAA